MLKLCNITKIYNAGSTEVEALKGIDLAFRKSEFVSVLGQSGCGKTTLLNIIGGLDRFSNGDLIINGRSTKKFSDHDWDTYRNHSVGFVFQNYNLIPHQTVLANVELALTLSGVSRAERRRRAEEALCKVGLEDQKNKKPNQMTGGQMQRVAIARALVNDPEIILADEPTGALDSETSVQIMELLKEVAKDRLVIMVTHNPDLAEQYSTRIIRLLDGRVISDTDPYESETPIKEESKKKSRRQLKRENRHTSMSFLTALSLSLNNLMTKKGRTTMVSFAGSIGIIGIALILSLSNGIQLYINSVQEHTLSSYPIALEAETMDMNSAITAMMEQESEALDHELDKVYSNPIMYKLMNSMSSTSIQKNDLVSFKKYLEENEETMKEYLTAVQYTYDVDFNVYIKNDEGITITDLEALFRTLYGDNMMDAGASFMGNMDVTLWQQMLGGENGEYVNDLLKEQFDVIHGSWPDEYNEVVVIVDKNNEVSDLALYSLGIKSEEDMMAIFDKMTSGEEINDEYESWSYEDICSRVYKIIPDAQYYQKSTESGIYSDITGSQAGLSYLYDNAVELKVSGIIRPNEDVSATMLQSGIGYTGALIDELIDRVNKTDAVTAQKGNANVDIFTGLPFKPADYSEPTGSEKAAEAKKYIASLKTDEKAKLALEILSTPDESAINAQVEQAMAGMDRAAIEAMILQSYIAEMNMDEEKVKEYIAGMNDETLFAAVREAVSKQMREEFTAKTKEQLSAMPSAALSATLDASLPTFSEERLAAIYDNNLPAKYSESTYEDNLTILGVTNTDTPAGINLFAASFENKDKISDMISEYNESVGEEKEITYTDYVGLIMSSVTTIINVISYVLIAFVAISLVVSSIMIGIITYISVLERTREIGVLRAIGASKSDITHVFNAESMIIGFVSGALGIGVTLLLTIPINIIVRSLTGVNVYAALPPIAGVALVIICILLNAIAGLLPSLMAAKKDPVEALRSE